MTSRDLDKAILRATVNLAERTGAKNLELGCLHEDAPPDKQRWWATVQYAGAVIMIENQPGPNEVLTALAEKLLTGAQCQRCGGLVALTDAGAFAYAKSHLVDGRAWHLEHATKAGTCRWTLVGERWESGCALPPEGDDDMHTAEKLARALADLNDPAVREIMWRARRGYYHAYLSPLATPAIQLVADLRAAGHEPMARRVIDGEFDESKAEADAWMVSPEGREAFAELIRPRKPAEPAAKTEKATGAAFWQQQRET